MSCSAVSGFSQAAGVLLELKSRFGAPAEGGAEPKLLPELDVDVRRALGGGRGDGRGRGGLDDHDPGPHVLDELLVARRALAEAHDAAVEPRDVALELLHAPLVVRGEALEVGETVVLGRGVVLELLGALDELGVCVGDLEAEVLDHRGGLVLRDLLGLVEHAVRLREGFLGLLLGLGRVVDRLDRVRANDLGVLERLLDLPALRLEALVAELRDREGVEEGVEADGDRDGGGGAEGPEDPGRGVLAVVPGVPLVPLVPLLGRGGLLPLVHDRLRDRAGLVVGEAETGGRRALEVQGDVADRIARVETRDQEGGDRISPELRVAVGGEESGELVLVHAGHCLLHVRVLSAMCCALRLPLPRVQGKSSNRRTAAVGLPLWGPGVYTPPARDQKSYFYDLWFHAGEFYLFGLFLVVFKELRTAFTAPGENIN